ncbi:MAG: DUF423 domain-containing protein [Candidatus Abyssubacteria bacterium]
MPRLWLLLAAASGFLTVLAGTFGAHVVALDEYGKGVYETAVHYQMFHTLALLAVGILKERFQMPATSLAGWGFLVGIVLFCGSLYLLAVTNVKWLGAIAPFGGVAFLLGWGALAFGMFRIYRSPSL